MLVAGIVLVLLGLLSIFSVNALEKRPLLVPFLAVIYYVCKLGDLPPIALGGINVFIMDILVVAAASVILPKIYAKLKFGFGREDYPLLLILTLSLVAFGNFLLGVKTFDIQSSANEFRSYLYYVVFLLYAALVKFDTKSWNKIERMWVAGACYIFVMACIGYATSGFATSDRPVSSGRTLFILQAGVIAVFAWINGRRISAFMWPVLFGFLPFILILQHRSVWIVTIASIISFYFLLPRFRGILFKTGVMAFVLTAIVVMVAYDTPVADELRASYKEAVRTDTTKKTSTFVWRIMGWQDFLTGEQMDAPNKVLFGNPFGTGFEREMVTSNGSVITIDVQPHNFYIQTLLRAGAVGVVCLILLNLYVLRQLLAQYRQSDKISNTMVCLGVLNLGMMVYYLVYGSTYTEGILLGFSISFLRQSKEEQLESSIA